MFKIAYGAGHNNSTSNGIPTSLHSPRVNEWYLNDRIARYFAQAAQEYEGVELLRVDDPKGIEPTVLANRVKLANDWGAEFFLAIHHNAGINGGSGGGLVAFSYKEGTIGAAYREAIYAACMAAGGLKGNRWDATLAEDFYVLKYTNMPAVLMEYGFMDSTTDVPVILQESYAKAMGYATMEGIAKAKGLTKKVDSAPVEVVPEPEAQAFSGARVSLQVLSQGSSGNQVKTLQRILSAMGYYKSGIDGSFGSVTAAAVKAFQRAAGITQDAIVGQQTWDKLLGAA